MSSKLTPSTKTEEDSTRISTGSPMIYPLREGTKRESTLPKRRSILPLQPEHLSAFTKPISEDMSRVEYLAFRLADEIYATPIQYILEILKPVPVTEVPRAPEYVLGIISVRGRILTIIDLRRRIHLVGTTITPKSRILLAKIPAAEGNSNEHIGLLVDEVLQVYRLTEHDIEPAHQAFGHDVTEYVIGIGRFRGILLFILNLKPILDARESTHSRQNSFGGKK